MTKMQGRRIESFRELRRLWREDYRRHQRRVIEPGLHIIATYRLGVYAEGLRWRLARWPVLAIYFFCAAFCELVYGSRIEPSCRIGRRLLIGHGSGGIVLGIDVTIGDDCILRHNVTLGRLRHTKPGDPTLGDRVEVGAGAAVLGPVKIGDDAIIGANVVVREDVPAGSIVLPPDPVVMPPRRSARLVAVGEAPPSPPLASMKDSRRPDA